MAKNSTAKIFKMQMAQRVRKVALGNTRTGLKEVCADLVNEYGNDARSLKSIAEGCFLSPGTVQRVSECDPYYRPQAETLERILRFFNCQVDIKDIKMQRKYMNKEKEF